MSVLNKGKLIVLDGLDGSGKATQAEILFNKLKLSKKKALQISFPNYKQKSSALVRMYLNSEFGKNPNEINPYATSSFYAVDRYASYVKFWQKKYENGYTIVADRYTSSNAVYQLCKLDKKYWNYYLDWLEDYEYNKLCLPCPDLTIYLDMSVEISQKFMSKRYLGQENLKDLHERDVEFLKKCREAAFFSAKRFGWCVLTCYNEDGPKSIEEIQSAIFNAVKDVIA